MPQRSIRTFTLDTNVQDQLDGLVTDFGARRLAALLPIINQQMTKTSPPAVILPTPVIDDLGLTLNNYDTLYEKHLSMVPITKRGKTPDLLKQAVNGYGFDFTGGGQRYKFNDAELQAAIKEMRRQNKHQIWRAKQAVCHRRLDVTLSPPIEKISASRLVDALLTLGINELEERVARRDGKDKKKASKQSANTPNRNANQVRHKSSNTKAR